MNRPDSLDKVLGRAVYSEDIALPGLLHGRVLRAAVPHGLIEELDVEPARKMDGVACVLTAKDVPGDNRYGIAFADQWALSEDRVISTADAVALVAAETEEIARDAVKAIRVKYRPLPVLTDCHQAMAEGAPQLHPGKKNNVFMHTKVRKGDLEAGFAQAAVIVENTYKTQVTDHAYLETEAGVGWIDPHGDLVIWSSCQYPFRDRRQVASVLGLNQNRVRCIRAVTGGAFGGKEDVTVEVALGLLIHHTRRPVRLIFDREESLTTQTKRHAIEIWTKWGATQDGRLSAMEGLVWGDTGAYAGLGPFAVKKCGIHLAGPYYIPHIKVDVWSVHTNNVIASAMRGFGVPQAAFAHERQMDELARRLGINPLRFRLMNALDAGLSTLTGHVMGPDVGIKASLEKIREEVLDDPSLRRYWEDLS
ncbi:MAG: molybdopterin cofactor-binding domain-containing protein [Thermodesulfobacteriota bacterium]